MGVRPLLQVFEARQLQQPTVLHGMTVIFERRTILFTSALGPSGTRASRKVTLGYMLHGLKGRRHFLKQREKGLHEIMRYTLACIGRRVRRRPNVRGRCAEFSTARTHRCALRKHSCGTRCACNNITPATHGVSTVEITRHSNAAMRNRCKGLHVCMQAPTLYAFPVYRYHH